MAAPFLRGRIIGITGSNGKTTTTSLIGHILREAGLEVQVGGNIGTPVTAMIASSRADGWNVLELSSFQLETIAAFRADIGLALNVTQNHLDRHHTFENYAAAKRRLFETMSADGCAVLNAEDPVCASFAKHTAATVRWFSGARAVEAGAYRRGDDLILDGRRLMSAGEIPLRGSHNIENVLAAAVAAARAGASDAKIAAAVKTFRAVEHRLEFVRNLSGVDFYNDSKATSVDATLKALDAFEGGLWVILGGKDKGLDYAPLRAPLAAKARAALLIGAAAPKIASALAGPLRWWKRARSRALSGRPMTAPSRAIPCCSRRPVPASTSSKVSNIAARCSKKSPGAWRRKVNHVAASENRLDPVSHRARDGLVRHGNDL